MIVAIQTMEVAMTLKRASSTLVGQLELVCMCVCREGGEASSRPDQAVTAGPELSLGVLLLVPYV